MRSFALVLSAVFGLLAISAGAAVACEYVSGDINGNREFNGLDVVYGVNYLKGNPSVPPDTCDCPPHGVIFAAADMNGNCQFNGIDITYGVNYLKGIGPAPRSCQDCQSTSQGPQLAHIPPQTVYEGEFLAFRVMATDPDNDPIALSAEMIPANGLFADSGNGVGGFMFAPDTTQAGAYQVRFIALAGELADTMGVAITVLDSAGPTQGIVANHLSYVDFDNIPLTYIQQARNEYRIFYGHTSHGSQIITGMTLLRAEDTSYVPPQIVEYGNDLGTLGDTTWAINTRLYLNAYPECNMIMWSWCGGVSVNTEEGINVYLNTMNRLESEYPGVVFVYMTGHLDGTGPAGNLYIRNNQIRQYCTTNNKVLFDFADIESHDPDGGYFPNGSDACEWCFDWCTSHECPSCGCAHSHCFNCLNKGKAWWWMIARLEGWTGSR